MAKLTFLGTGTSQGIPVIGCDCEVCCSTDPHDQRLRSSVLYTTQGCNILIDAGPDFRQQMLRAKVQHLDAILLTHEHNDHVIGLDDVRPFNFSTGRPMRVYALNRVASEVRKRFEYVFGEAIPGLPRIELVDIEAGQTLDLGGTQIESISIMHGALPILGFRFDHFVYITDMKTISEEAFARIRGAKVVVINALHRRDHHAHMTLREALAFAERLHDAGTKEIWLTHMSHQMGRAAEVCRELPDYVRFSFDQLTFEV